MKTLLIVYHSMTGGTLQMAQAAAAGARSEPALRVSLLQRDMKYFRNLWHDHAAQ